jgi:transketolase
MSQENLPASRLLSLQELEAVAKRLRRHIVTMIGAAASGHPGGSLSCVEILTALFFRMMNVDPRDPCQPDRDRFILSKGHAAPALYATLAEKGFFPTEELLTLRQLGSRLQGHPDRNCTPGVEMNAGSEGLGLSFGIGQALAARLDGRPYRVYVLLGDGECQEGQVWEAALFAHHHKVANLCAIVDRNRIQLSGFTEDIIALDPLKEKWQAFGWQALEADGHSLVELLHALETARKTPGRPTVVIAKTVKGKGVSFMENNPEFHGKAPTPAELEQALKELA